MFYLQIALLASNADTDAVADAFKWSHVNVYSLLDYIAISERQKRDALSSAAEKWKENAWIDAPDYYPVPAPLDILTPNENLNLFSMEIVTTRKSSQ